MTVRDKILDASGVLFLQYGVKTITMDAIAQSLGISKRTIYENFKDKDDLVGNFLLKTTLHEKMHLLEIINESNNVIEALLNFGSYYYQMHVKANPLFIADLKKYHPNIFDNILNNMSIQHKEISYTLIKKGINEGTFIKTLDIKIVNDFIIHTLKFVGENHCEQKTDPDKIWRNILYPYLKGICTEKGIEILEIAQNKIAQNK